MSRYGGFWSRQAYRGFVTLGSSVNFATCMLFNNSTGDRYIVVRDWRIRANGGTQVGFAYRKGLLGSAGGTITALVPEDPVVAGQMSATDQAGAITNDYMTVMVGNDDKFWQHDFPFAVLKPGDGLVAQVQVAATFLSLGLIWEAPLADQLESYFEQFEEHTSVRG